MVPHGHLVWVFLFAAAFVAGDSELDAVRELAQLRDANIITTTEFILAKKQLLESFASSERFAGHCQMLPPNLHARPDKAPETIPWAKANSAGAAGFWRTLQKLEPAVYRGAAADWPARQWTAKSVAARLPGTRIRIEDTDRNTDGWAGADTVSDEKDSETKLKEMLAADFLLDRNRDPRRKLYWAEDDMPPQLHGDVRAPPFAKFLGPPMRQLMWWTAEDSVTRTHFPFFLHRCEHQQYMDAVQVTRTHYDSFENILCMIQVRATLACHFAARYALARRSPPPTAASARRVRGGKRWPCTRRGTPICSHRARARCPTSRRTR